LKYKLADFQPTAAIVAALNVDSRESVPLIIPQHTFGEVVFRGKLK
jgi:hypothetical protein